MLVPQTRLVVWSAIMLIPFSLLIILGPVAAMASGIALLLFLAVVVGDSLSLRGIFDGLKIEMPQIVRLQRLHPGKIEIKIHNNSSQTRLIRLGLAFPTWIESENESLSILLPENSVVSRIQWECTPQKRGQYFMEGCHVEITSRFGLWAFRKHLPGRSEFRIYPNLHAERKHVSALFLNRGNFGIHAQRAAGRGREFEKLRDYNPGDALNDIHWKASAKRGRPMTKVYQIERTQEVYVVIDSSRLSVREDMLERSLTASLVLALAAEQQGDHFGLVIFNDKVSRFVRAKSGPLHFNVCRDALYTEHPKMVSPDFDELSAFLQTRLRKRALLVFFTALDDPLLAESFSRNMDFLSRRHLILVNMLRPSGAAPLFSESSVSNLNQIYERLGGHLQWHDLKELEKRFQRRGVRFNLLENESLCAQVVAQYSEVKTRQLV